MWNESTGQYEMQDTGFFGMTKKGEPQPVLDNPHNKVTTDIATATRGLTEDLREDSWDKLLTQPGDGLKPRENEMMPPPGTYAASSGITDRGGSFTGMLGDYWNLRYPGSWGYESPSMWGGRDWFKPHYGVNT